MKSKKRSYTEAGDGRLLDYIRHITTVHSILELELKQTGHNAVASAFYQDFYCNKFVEVLRHRFRRHSLLVH